MANEDIVHLEEEDAKTHKKPFRRGQIEGDWEGWGTRYSGRGCAHQKKVTPQRFG